MPAAAELSSFASQLDDLVQRIGAAGEALDGEATADAAAALFEAERALRTAVRSVRRAAQLLE